MKQKYTSSGFSLIELSVWVMLIALFMSTMLSWLTPPAVEEADKLALTNKRMDKIEQALEVFRVRYGRLPCPADSSLADTAGEAYREYCVTSATAGIKNVGTIPTKSLGLQGEDALDGWGRRFTYQVSTNLCDVDNDGAAPTGDAIRCTPTQYRCGPSGGPTCIQDPTSNVGAGDLSLYKYVSGVASTISTTIAYVLVSHGPDGQCAYMTTGSQRDTGAGCTDGGTANIGRDENFYTYAAAGNDTVFFTDAYGTPVTSYPLAADGAFDDLVRYKTKQQIEARTLDTYAYALPLNPVAAPAKIGCTDTVTVANDINSIDEAIKFYDTAVATNINAGTAIFSPNATDRYLGILWTMQEICQTYYSSYTRACPNTGLYGTNKTYYPIYHGCCASATCP